MGTYTIEEAISSVLLYISKSYYNKTGMGISSEVNIYKIACTTFQNQEVRAHVLRIEWYNVKGKPQDSSNFIIKPRPPKCIFNQPGKRKILVLRTQVRQSVYQSKADLSDEPFVDSTHPLMGSLHSRIVMKQPENPLSRHPSPFHFLSSAPIYSFHSLPLFSFICPPLSCDFSISLIHSRKEQKWNNLSKPLNR